MKRKRSLRKEEVLVIERAANTKTQATNLGELELKYVSLSDYFQMAGLLKEVKNAREFSARVLYNQLIKPKISLEELLELPDDELRKIARDFVANEGWLFKYFNETSDTEFFENFRKAIKERYSKEAEILKSNLEPIVESVKTTLDTFHKNLRDINVPRILLQTFHKELATSLSAFDNLVANSQLRIAESIESIARQWESTARLISETVRPQIEMWQNWTVQNRSIFRNIAAYWKEFEQKYKIAEQEAATILRKYKWLITPSMPITFLFHVVTIGRRRGNQRGTLNKLFVAYFLANDCRNLEEFVNKWQANPLFRSRIKIFKDCVSVIRSADGKFNPSNLVLPTLISQVDGIRLDFIKRNGLTFWSEDKRWKPLFKNQTSNQGVLDLANDIFLEILFQKSVPGAPLQTPFVFNRHKIMHGEYLKYGRIDNTIRAFLVLDFLAWLK